MRSSSARVRSTSSVDGCHHLRRDRSDGGGIPLFDFLNNVPDGSASVEATFSLLGVPVTSTVLSQNSRERVTQQGLLPDGTLVFPTGDEFTLDDEHCFAATFDSHLAFTPSAGPKPGGKAPVNDTPEGALPIRIGGVVNAQTGGTAPDPEMQVTTCPEPPPFDAVGHTLWFSFTGTGGPVTIDSGGSNFDTVVAVYDDELNELACIDDNEFEPVGFTFQGALTVDTVEGDTYYVQAGGFLDLFDRRPKPNSGACASASTRPMDHAAGSGFRPRPAALLPPTVHAGRRHEHDSYQRRMPSSISGSGRSRLGRVTVRRYEGSGTRERPTLGNLPEAAQFIRAVRSAAATSDLPVTRSLRYACSRCLATVAGAKNRRRAISALLRPVATRATTCASRIVSPASSGRSPASMERSRMAARGG